MLGADSGEWHVNAGNGWVRADPPGAATSSGAQLTARFQKAEDEYFKLKGQLGAGRITHEQFEGALKEALVEDDQGRYWMLGVDTGKWYVHEGATWVEAIPPGMGTDITPPPLDPRFQKAEDEYFKLKGQLGAGRITHEQFEAALKESLVEDDQGRYWMLGVDSGKWYVHEGENWVESNPPPAPVRPPAAGNLPPPLTTPLVAPVYVASAAQGPPPAVAPAKSGGRFGCLGKGCLALIVVGVLAGALGSIFYFRVPQRIGLVQPATDRVLSSTPDRSAADALKTEVANAGIDTQGMEFYVIPFKDRPGALAYVVLDSSHGFHFKSGSSDPLIDFFKQLGQGQAASQNNLTRIAIEYKSQSGASLVNLTAPTDAITAYSNGSLSRQEFLKKLDGQANWTAFFQEGFK